MGIKQYVCGSFGNRVKASFVLLYKTKQIQRPRISSFRLRIHQWQKSTFAFTSALPRVGRLYKENFETKKLWLCGSLTPLSPDWDLWKPVHKCPQTKASRDNSIFNNSCALKPLCGMRKYFDLWLLMKACQLKPSAALGFIID